MIRIDWRFGDLSIEYFMSEKKINCEMSHAVTKKWYKQPSTKNSILAIAKQLRLIFGELFDLERYVFCMNLYAAQERKKIQKKLEKNHKRTGNEKKFPPLSANLSSNGFMRKLKCIASA